MKKLRMILMMGIMVVAMAGLAGCGKTLTVEKSFTADEVNRIEIKSNLNDIITRATSGDQLI